MDFRILGRLEVSDGDGPPLALGGTKQRALLALLILHRAEIVSTDRLADELWGEVAPATASKTLQGYVSRLRKVLGDGVLQTHGHGYRLAIAPGDLDAARFEQLVADARAAAEDGALDDAARLLGDALALWRGQPLGDLAFEPALRGEVARLEEVHLAALEDRFDTGLARGRHSELVPELEGHVRAHPLRERARGQLMVALYRCGRQADALAAYQDGRRTLVEELGLDPGPALQALERQILAQDAELDGPRRALPAARRIRGPYAGPRLVGAGLVLLALVIAGIVVGLTRDRGGSTAAVLAADSVGVIDPHTMEITAAIRVPGAPARLAVFGGGVWIGSDAADTLSALDVRAKTVARVVAPGAFPSDIAAGEGALWVLDRERGQVLRVDPAYGTVEATIRIGRGGPFLHDRTVVDPWAIAAGVSGVWVTDGSPRLVQIDPHRNRILRRIETRRALGGVTVADDAVWAISGPSAEVLRIDPSRGVVTNRIPIVSRADFASPYPIQVEGGAGALWVLNANTGTVSRIDPAQRGVQATVSVGVEHVPLRIAAGDSAVWVAAGDGTLTRIDARTNAVRTSGLAHALADVAVTREGVLAIGAAGPGTAPAKGVATGSEGSVRALRSAFCSPVYHAAGLRPRYLIAADLPLQGMAATQGAQMSQAIQFLMRSEHFRAGRYALGLQIECDRRRRAVQLRLRTQPDPDPQRGAPRPARDGEPDEHARGADADGVRRGIGSGGGC
jgi:DNA-binding SARP family transcriptional activator/DNA-binding beta-propeller fold protein YncE